MTLPAADVARVAGVLAEQAAVADDPRAFLRDLVQRTPLPSSWRLQVAGKQYADLLIGTRELVRWAAAKGVNPADPTRTALGSLISTVLGDVGSDIAADLVAVAVHYDMVRSSARADLVRQFQVPSEGVTGGDAFSVPVPDDGSGDDVASAVLQRLAARAPELLDVGALATAIRRAAGVCRVETVSGRPLGSGFLITPVIALTNRHVMEAARGEELVLRFRCTSTTEGVLSTLDPDEPVPRWSAVSDLDVAALRLVAPPAPDAGVEPITLAVAPEPVAGDDLSILQHPAGGPMMLALTVNGVVGTRDGGRTVRYATSTAGGSSGSPCFDEQWRLVAIHRAERATMFGAVREGVLIARVLDFFADLL